MTPQLSRGSGRRDDALKKNNKGRVGACDPFFFPFFLTVGVVSSSLARFLARDPRFFKPQKIVESWSPWSLPSARMSCYVVLRGGAGATAADLARSQAAAFAVGKKEGRRERKVTHPRTRAFHGTPSFPSPAAVGLGLASEKGSRTSRGEQASRRERREAARARRGRGELSGGRPNEKGPRE